MTEAPHFRTILTRRLARRDLLRGGAAAAAATLSGCIGLRPASGHDGFSRPGPGGSGPGGAAIGRDNAGSRFTLAFETVPATTADRVTVPAGYQARTLIRFADPLFQGDEPVPDPRGLSSAQQQRRFGANNDMIALFPLTWSYPWPRDFNAGAILAVNHEYFDAALQLGADVRDPTKLSAARPALYASMGVTIARLSFDATTRTWAVVREPAARPGVNRRITPFSEVEFDGPARDHPWIRAAAKAYRTAYGPASGDGVACGTLANCAGGLTPWGTYLTSEENFQNYFFTRAQADPGLIDARLLQDAQSFQYDRVRANPAPAGLDVNDLGVNPTGPAAYGWVVEIDPYDPDWRPRKRTALGRRKGECATTTITRDGRVAVYSGDDQLSEHIYKFVSARRFNPRDRRANLDLLSEGALYAARFEPDGAGRWVRLEVDAANAKIADPALRLADAADLLVRARYAARLLGATPMDRPEDVEVAQGADFLGTGVVLVSCTQGVRPTAAIPGNPRRAAPGEVETANLTGHILKLMEDDADHASQTFRWEVFVLAGDPDGAAPLATTKRYGPVNVSTLVDGAGTFTGARFACPDNLALDGAGNVFIATDGSDELFPDCNDQVLACAVDGGPSKPLRRFLVGPLGAEICGPFLTPDRTTFFCSIQHPGEADGAGERFSAAIARDARAQPASAFPDGGWPRSAVVYVTREDGAAIGA